MKPFIWTEKTFVSPEDIASKWTVNGPYLYEVPSIINARKLLMSALCIKDKFTIEKLLRTLREMHQQLEENQLDETHQKVVNAIVGELNTYKKDDFKNFSNEASPVILPSAVNTLMLAENLSYNDSQWLAADKSSTLVHTVLQREVALALGVKPIRAQFLDKFAAKNAEFGGTKFGQREDLTRRIQNVLRDYPLDATILKELLQNADDAGATKMCIILDKRQHGTECLPSKEWSELQGPALVVWNNEEFKEKDIEGIQKLGLGSKRDDSESIGQFGIGFNVVYHLTDCPSFISGGKTLCVFDPHCRYAPGADQANPGRRFDCLQEDEFWDGMSDMRSAYFQNPPLQDQPTELHRGSLFRFPLRSTRELVMQSEIVENKVTAKELSSDVMEKLLDNWALQIKESLVFLNHIADFSYYVVDETQFNLKCQYKLGLDSAAVESRNNMVECLKVFKKNKQPDVFNYQISLECTEVNQNDAKETQPSNNISPFTEPTPSQSYKTYQEQWFIQQGVGNISKSECEQKWQYIDRVLPKHGIATPVNVSQQLVGKLFCFLPLQTESGLPVHINGQFVLSNNRCSLWAGSAEGADDKRDWNNLLFDAIASSYAHFMTEVQGVLVKDGEYADKNMFYACINKYYSLFPMWSGLRNIHLHQNCFVMAKLVFQRIWQSNAKVLAVEIHSKKDVAIQDEAPVSTVKVQWNELRNQQDPFKQVYFQPELDNKMEKKTEKEKKAQKEEKKKVIFLLRRIHMTLTCAPHIFYKNLITEEETKPSIATPASVFQFYCLYHSQIIEHGLPCPIQDTPFKTAETFYKFIIYILVAIPNSIRKRFPKSPFGYPLLLTADDELRCFDLQNKVIESIYTELFPNSLSSFLHHMFRWSLDSEYFLDSNQIQFSPVIENLLMDNLPNELLNRKVNNVSLGNLGHIWNCLTSESDPLLENHQKEILSVWALTPATNGYMYSTRCSTLPILPPCLDELDSVDRTAYDIFTSVGLAIIDDSDLLSNCGLLEVCQNYFPTIIHYDQILTILYHLHQEQYIFDNISSSDVKSVLKYFQKTGFIYNKQLKKQIVSLPLFKSIEGCFTTLRGKSVYQWPESGFCVAGYSKWAPSDSVVFLEWNGDWRALTNDFSSIDGKVLHSKIIYIDLIFPCFDRLSFDERKSHLKYIMEKVYPYLIQHKQMDMLFLSSLKELKCIEHPKSPWQLCCISDFSDHTKEIFRVFSESFIFLPEVYQKDKWYEFFCDLNLQKAIDTKSFIEFCFKVQNGTHDIQENIETASRVLLEYLFSSKAREWDDDSLQEIADIGFVKVAKVPHLSWIETSCSERRGVNLIKLNHAALFEAAPLIWTVKPVFHQPPLETKEENDTERAAFLKKLSVTSSPSSKDIVQNLINISNSHFSDFNLFTTYKSVECSHSLFQLSLLDVVCTCMETLKDNKCSLNLLSPLKDCACVPVFTAKPPNVVLVRPTQVVKTFDDNQLKPYVNELPDVLVSYYPIFEAIGVCSTVDLVHVQYVLQTLNSTFGNGKLTDDPNIIQLMYHSIVKLNELLLSKKQMRRKPQHMLDQLRPLYLPFSTGQHTWSLKSSEELVFVDSSRYQSRQPEKFNLAGTGYSLFEIPKDSSPHQYSLDPSAQIDYILAEKNFCLLLPTEVRPLQLSLCSFEKKLNVGSAPPTSNNNSIAIACLNQSKGFLENFKMILKQMCTSHMEFLTHTEIEIFIGNFFNIIKNIDFVLIEGLQASLIFTVFNKNIATLTSPKYVLEEKQKDYTLYIANSESHNVEPEFFLELSRTILIEIARLTGSNLTYYFNMINCISKFLQIRSSTALLELGRTYKVSLSVSAAEGNVNSSIELEYTSPVPKVGKEVPEFFMSRLDNSVNNIFYPQKWVAYEISEEYFIWAMVLYPVPPDESNESNQNRSLDRYRIVVSVISDNENKEIEVSVADLYSILPIAFSQTEPSADDSDACRVGEPHTVIAIKHNIYTDLSRISQLTDDSEKRRAIKRLYLLYHPDKVDSSNEKAYEEGFKYLKRQVDRLERGEPLEDPNANDSDGDNDETTRHAHTAYEPSQMSSSYFNQWESYIPRRSRYASSQRPHAGPTCGSGSSSDFTEYQPQPDQDKAQHWLKQSHTDCSAMNVLLEKVHQCHYEKGDKDSVVCQTIFLAHEVIEKALKAGMYKLVGLNEELYLKSHELLCHAKSISSQRPGTSLVRFASWIEHFYLDSRFPNRYSNRMAPVDVCLIEDAETAAEYAQMTLACINSL